MDAIVYRQNRLDRFLRFGIAVLALVVVLALAPVTRDPVTPIKTLAYQLGVATLASCWLASTWWSGRQLIRPWLFGATLLALLAVFLFAALQAPSRGYALDQLAVFAPLVLLYFLAADLYRTPEQVRRLLLVVCVGVTISSAYGFAQWAGWDPFPWADRSVEQYRNLPATFGNPNMAAHTLSMAIIMAFYLGMRLRAFYCIGFVAVFCVHLYFTQQRAGLVALAAGVVFLLAAVVAGNRWRRPVSSIFIALITVVLVGALAAGAGMFLYRGSGRVVDTSTILRADSVHVATRMVAARPVLGWGPGAFKTQSQPFWTDFSERWFGFQGRQSSHVHCDILEVMVEGGLSAGFLFLGFLVSGMAGGLYLAYRSRDVSRRRLGYALAVIFCVFAVDGLFGFNLHVPTSAFLILLMAGVLEGSLSTEWKAPPFEAKPRRVGALLWRVVILALVVAVCWMALASFGAAVYEKRGRVAQSQKQYRWALAEYQAATRWAPWYWLALTQEAQVFEATHQYEAAVEAFEAALSQNANQPMVHVGLARAHYARASVLPPGQRKPYLDRAGEQARLALDLCAYLHGAEEMLGLVILGYQQVPGALGDNDTSAEARSVQAEQHLLRAIRFGSDRPAELYRLMAGARITRNAPVKALDSIMRSIAINPAPRNSWDLFWQASELAGDYSPLLNALEEQLEAQGTDETSRTRMIHYSLLKGRVLNEGMDDPDAATDWLAHAVRRYPMALGIWSAYYDATVASDRYDRFVSDLTYVVAEQGGQGDYETELLQSALNAMTDDIYELRRATQKVIQKLQEMSVGGYNEEELSTAGWIPELALRQMENVEGPDSILGQVYVRLGLCFARTARLEKALEAFDRALQHVKGRSADFCLEQYQYIEKRLETSRR